MANEDNIDDFLEGPFLSPFKDGETRELEFDVSQSKVVDKKDFNGEPIQVLRLVVRVANSKYQSWKYWDLSRKHANVYRELKHGNQGKGWTVMQITRQGLYLNTRYMPKGVK